MMNEAGMRRKLAAALLIAPGVVWGCGLMTTGSQTLRRLISRGLQKTKNAYNDPSK
jgi:hypothetical protein